MGVQTASVIMVALGVGTHPSLRPGVHLRWFVDPSLGFPPLGFDVFRRPERSGTWRSLDFAGEPEGQLAPTFARGPTVWSTAVGQSPSEIFTETTGQGDVRLLRPSRASAITCRLDPSERPVRRIQVDIVHAVPQFTRLLPFEFVVWGVAGNERVAMGAATLTEQNRWTTVAVTVTGDALEGFQIEGGRTISNFYGILGVRWIPVAGEADVGWGTPSNPRRIGFPVTAPGYLVTHKYSPDQGLGAQDWLEAADRLSPTGANPDLPAALRQQFGPPAFAGTRQVLGDVLARRQLTRVGTGPQEPNVKLDAVRLVLLGALDPDFARLAGLGLVDSSAVPGQRYDYKVVGYWPGRLRSQLVCVDVPNGGGQIPTGGSVTLPGGGGASTVVTAGTVLEPANPVVTLGVTGVAGAAWSPDGQQVLTWTGTGGAWVWDAVGGEIVELTHDVGVVGAAWSPDQQQVVTWARDQVVRIWGVATAGLQQAMRHPAPVLGAAWAPDERQLLTWAEDGQVRIWGVGASGDPLVAWLVPACLGAAWGPDGQRVLTWAKDGRVQVWAAEQAALVSGRLHRARPLGAAWSPDGQQVLSWAQDGAVWVWPVEGTGDPLVLRHPPGLIGAAWSPDGQQVLSWHRDGSAWLWKMPGGGQLRMLPHDAGVAGAGWSPDGARVLSWAADGVARAWEITQDDPPQVFADTGMVVGAGWGGGRQVVTWTAKGIAQLWSVPARVRSLTFTLPAATDQLRVTGRSAGPEPLTIRAFSGAQMVRAQAAPPGLVTTVAVDASGMTSVTVAGDQVTVTQLCRLELVQEPDQQEVWICFGVSAGPVPTLTRPAEPTATALPGFARDGSAEQIVGLVIEPPPPPRPATELFPPARSVHDPVSYQVRRRADGAQPVADPAAGPWLDLITDPASGQPRWADLAIQPPAGPVRPVLRSTLRPALHTSPQGWPAGAQDLLDGRLDPAVRYYSYRVRGRDLFGRVSDWSAPVTVDAADRVAPPAPGALTARWVDRADPWLGLDDLAELDASGVDRAVMVRWSWPHARREQAPDTQAFRVYWHSRPFSTLLTAITADPQVAATTYTVSVTLGLGAPPADAFRGDWLRQDNHQYLILASSATDPTSLVLDATGVQAPTRGPCAVSLRAPDAQRLDLLGNPLRPDPTRATVWERRVRQGPLTTVEAAILQQTPGVAVTCQQIRPDTPRSGVATVVLSPDWHWSGVLPEPAQLGIGILTPSWRVLGSTLGRIAVLLVETGHKGPPPLGPAILLAAGVHTLTLDVQLPTAAPFTILGGTARTDTETLEVLAHATAPLRLLVAPGTGASRLSWFPDHQVVLNDVTLAVSDATPQATGLVGVSAVDGRPWTADPRARTGEPRGPGNEGPVSSATVRRHHLAIPTATATPAGTTGPSELWAPVPEEFSGQSRFPLRWPVGGATSFQVEHATLDAVLDADLADRAALRGTYVGSPPLDAAGLAQWRTQQAALGAADLQKLATAQPSAFLPLTDSPLPATDPLLADPQPGWLHWSAPLDGSAPGRHFLRIRVVDAAGNAGPPGPATLPIVVPDGRRPRPPQLRRAVGVDRAVWLQWDVSDAGAQYRVYRAQLATGAAPDVRDMTLVATLPDTRCPEPVAVFAGQARLPGPQSKELVAVYRAEDYDAGLAPGAQTATPVAGATITNGTVADLHDLPDGSLVFAVVRYAAGEQPRLAVSGTGRAYRDTPVGAWDPHQYRVVAVRDATTGPATKVRVASFASGVAEAVAFDARPLVPPQVTAVWDAAAAAVRLTWPTAGLPTGLEVLPQRMDIEFEEWVGVARWVTASTGTVLDAGVFSGRSYLYRLRVRVGNRTSEAEPTFGPIVVP
jgi:WD40 repeat protein